MNSVINMQKFPLVSRTAELRNDTWKVLTRLNVNGRINFRAYVQNQLTQFNHYPHLFNIVPKTKGWFEETLTKEQRLENYELRCIENNKRPYHFTDTQWEMIQREFADEKHEAKNYSKMAWLYEN